MKKREYRGKDPIIGKLVKLATPKVRKHRPLPGGPLRKSDLLVPGIEAWAENNWHKLTNNSIVVGWTVAYIRGLDPTSKYRFPLDKTSFERVMQLYGK
jgi:hypothetical protein